ncbi:glycoside hydrolase family 3 N-terminal domain-containing protein [Mangrovibacterium lignilyticum]|uniref:glycoside hydrolase family 3 N-terminal domain-containing protein n=1 Tax=Mangrovibacterium lignilyticum TaxID=2668052 RepID=UPI0013D6A5E6|nr:glycoside hydrolase family 3 N-terminal domain-containing protein [Mangrovibacterium lignilyticum]
MKYLSRALVVVVIFCLSTSYSTAQTKPKFLDHLHDAWVDSLIDHMSLDEKIGQLFIVQAYSTEGKTADAVLADIRNHQVGGIIFMQGTAPRQVELTNQFQEASKIPLLIAIDGEWGPAFRLKDTPRYPVQMALGAIQEDSLIYQMGREIGTQFRRMGVHINFAPVSDVNNNPNNPVINYRSFGENPENVAKKAWLYAKGMQDVGLLAVAKHFPGHGDTNVDSHIGLPVIKHDKSRLDQVEMYPFKELIQEGIGGVMTAHIQVPALEPDPKLPASLSPAIIQKKLINEFGFGGIVFTDAMNMQGVTKLHSPGEAAVLALKAGNDMLEIVPDLSEAILEVTKAVRKNQISEKAIDLHCRKILALKKWMELDSLKTVDPVNIQEDLNKPGYELTRRLLHEQSMTVLINRDNMMPLQKLDTLQVAVVSFGKTSTTAFQKMAARYMTVDLFNLRKEASADEINQLINQLKPYNLVICGIHNLNLSPIKNYGTTTGMSELIQKLKDKKLILSVFGNPYALDKIKNIETADGLLLSYQENSITEELSAQAIFGSIKANGKLPVNVNAYFRLNDGLNLKKIDRLKYTIPEEVKISSTYLEHRIDSVVMLGIERQAYPGCQVLIAVDGKVILNKAYGYHTYDDQEPVLESDVYDIASITKITGPTPALIKLYDEKKFKLDMPFSFYWPPFRGTDKEKMTSRQILSHQARLKPWIPFWQNELKNNGNLRSAVFRETPDNDFNIRVSSHLYMDHHNINRMYNEIKDSPLLSRSKYTYSDLGFLIFPKIIQELANQDYESYLAQNFYLPLGASNITYNAYKHFPQKRIVPTEQDDSFRHELLQGYVHDEGASMLGGVSGNAGIFSNANDLAKLMEMYLQFGHYGGIRYLDSTSIAEFTRVQYPKNDNRRGLGFDKPYIDNYKNTLENAFPAVDASPESFGHTGFTGTFVWMDPKYNILFIFLSNRVYPTRNNNKLSRLNIRPAMHQVVYDALFRGI